MNGAEIERAARILFEARQSGQLIDHLPQGACPRSLEVAYRIQDRLVELLGQEVGGWFLGCTNQAIQKQLGMPSPYSARLLAPTIFRSGAVLDFPARLPIVLEVEFAFRLAEDLPPRKAPYRASEVWLAIESVHPAIEIVVSRFVDWTNQPIWSLVADNGTDGALVYGVGLPRSEVKTLSGVDASLSIDGQAVRRGGAENITGGPLGALTWLANQPRREPGLLAGHIVNTGSCTSMYFAAPRDSARAEFGDLGGASVTVRAAEDVS